MSTATAPLAEATLPLSTVEPVVLDITNNWTGVDVLPFELLAERVLEIEADGPNGKETGPFSIRFGKPLYIDGRGWACVFQMSALGRVHVSPARGVDAVDALQAAFAMVAKQLAGMGRMHRITFGGGEDLGFAQAAAQPAKAAGCPVMGGGMSL